MRLSRRDFAKAMGLAGAGLVATSASGGEPRKLKPESTARVKAYRDKALGCFMGAAIADAMGGPVECQHYKRIAKKYPEFEDFLPYRKPPGLIDINPGYALDDEPGNVTDDTYIRADLARFVVNNDPPYTASRFASWLLRHADFSNWWQVAVKPLRRIERGEITAERAGQDHRQGGGGGWWQPIAILHAGDQRSASAVCASLCRIWKAPLEQDILSSVVAGQAAAYEDGATIDSVVAAVLEDSGPLARKLFERAIEIARGAKNRQQLYEQLYAHCLVQHCTTEIDGPMPPHVVPKDYADGFYSGILFAEQQPFALAYFVYGQGDPKRTVLTAVKGGRDADSIATNSASWLGAMSGESVWPKSWLETVQKENLPRLNLRQMAEDLVVKGLRNETVRITSVSNS